MFFVFCQPAYMKILLFCGLLIALMPAAPMAMAQSKPKPVQATAASLPEKVITKAETEAHLRFLAADELQGRRTGDPGSLVAARYIAEQFRQLGLKPAPGQTDYFQMIPMLRYGTPGAGTIMVGRDTLKQGVSFVTLSPAPGNLTAETMYVGYGLTDGPDGYNGRDVKGKIVVAQVGSPETTTGGGMTAASQQKRRMAAEKGAVAVIELYTQATYPWPFLTRYLSGEQTALKPAADEPQIPHLWVDNGKNQLAILKEAGQMVRLQTAPRPRTELKAMNVVAVVEGTDPKLKNEYVLLSAHYDHVGVGKQGGQAISASDSIFNGARDNAFGTVGLLTAAKALKARPPKRSVLLVAYTAEEVGLLGSRYYAEHPLIPLNQTIFNLNIDAAGYNDTSVVSVIGLDRTGARIDIEAAARAFGMGVVADPAPEQGLFDRSDNVSLAAKGVPAPTFSPGFRTFDESLARYYHQVTDNPDTIDFDYLLKFCQAYARAARLIADRPIRPMWIAGDKYEAAAKALYK